MSSQLKQLKAQSQKKKQENQGISSNSESCFFRQLKESSLHPKIIKQARKSGQLNLSNRGIAEMPDIVWNINALTAEETKTLSFSMDSATDQDQWWDYVDLTKLILASNVLKSISPEISNYPALTVLDLHDNCLTSLPESIAKLQLLTKLNLSRNQFEELPLCIFQLKMLRTLFIQHNQLKTLVDDIGNLSYLEELDVSHNKLQSLPHCIGFLSHVTIFNASTNELVHLPLEIGDMCALKRLELSCNKILELPKQIEMLHHLEQLYIQHNNLNSIPTLSRCTALKEIHCGFNGIEDISQEFLETLSCIKLLDFRDNKISEIPENISWLQTLERLDLSNNNLSNLPYALGTLPHLKFLSIDGNPMRSIRRDIIQRGTVQLLRWLRSRIEDPTALRSFSRMSTSEVDGAKGSGNACDIDKYTLQSTKTLTYSNQAVSSLPQELIEKAIEAEVTIVDLSKNNISEIPENMQNLLPKLTELNLSFNKLASLPSFMGVCCRLQFLDIRNNRLDDLPSEMSRLEQLREINVCFNKFQKLPGVLYQLKRLEIIIASDNQISEIDVGGLSLLASISVLDLHNNSIKIVPPELGTLTQLRSLLLDGNLFRNPRPAILSKGTSVLLEFLRGRMAQH